jgi:hypothetical protein
MRSGFTAGNDTERRSQAQIEAVARKVGTILTLVFPILIGSVVWNCLVANVWHSGENASVGGLNLMDIDGEEQA